MKNCFGLLGLVLVGALAVFGVAGATENSVVDEDLSITFTQKQTLDKVNIVSCLTLF